MRGSACLAWHRCAAAALCQPQDSVRGVAVVCGFAGCGLWPSRRAASARRGLMGRYAGLSSTLLLWYEGLQQRAASWGA